MEKSSAAIFLLLLASAASAPPDVKKSKSDYTYNSNSDAFYKLHTEGATVLEARAQCQSEAADLMDPVVPHDLQQLIEMMKQHPGLGDVYIANEGQKYDPDLAKVYYKESSEDINEIVNKEIECRVVASNGMIKTASCRPKLPFICKVKATDVPCKGECEGYVYEKQTNCYYKTSSAKANWEEARASCESEGTHLAVLRNEKELEVVKNLVQKVPDSVEDWQFFMGLSAEKSPMIFKTIFNQTLSDFGYAPWDDGEPNNEGAELCGTVWKRNGKYNNSICSNRYAFVCQKEVMIDTLKTN